MSTLYEVPAGKAIIGAAFIQYLFYGLIYVVEGVKLEELEGKAKEQNAKAEEAKEAEKKNKSPVKATAKNTANQ